MNRARRLLDRCASAQCDKGFTLVEAVVAMFVFLTALSVMTAVVAAMTASMRKGDGISQAADQVRLVFQRLDKQVRYAEAISVPGAGSDAAWYVEFSAEDNERDSRTDPARKADRCHQWRVRPDGHLQTRTWLVTPNGTTSEATAWLTVATGINNNLATEPPFLPPPTGGRLQATPTATPAPRDHQGLTVDFRARRSNRPPGVAQLKATFFARNSSATTSLGVCDQLGRS